MSCDQFLELVEHLAERVAGDHDLTVRLRDAGLHGAEPTVADDDLHSNHAAEAYLRTADQLADETGQPDLAAWVLETRAWQALTAGEFRRAAALSQAAQLAAPHASSAHLQAVAQEGRAWARAGDPAETRRALTRLETLVSPLPVPDRPEHHYRYDPPKSRAYVATTLAWAGDAAAEGITRESSPQSRRPVPHRRGRVAQPWPGST